MNDEFLQFEDEDDGQESAVSGRAWKILIVDDEADVHRATRYALRDTPILGRRLEFISAYSAEEARILLYSDPDIAVILLDVVMETETSGLDLVRAIRDELKMTDVRIVLRTGQPGYAPEDMAIRAYDINDYKNKSELTHTRLLTTITAAIRAWIHIRALEQGRRNLEQIVDASAELMSAQQLRRFAEQVSYHAGSIFSVSGDSIVLSSLPGPETGQAPELKVMVARGHFSSWLDYGLSQVPDSNIRHRIQIAMEGRRSVLDENSVTVFSRSQSGNVLVAYLEGTCNLQAEHAIGLLDVYATTVAMSLENVALMARLKQYAYNDLTLEIPNRLSFVQRIDQLLQSTPSEPINILLCDLDQFAAINDTIGSQQGDLLLRSIRDRLRNELPDDVFIGRISGDTFGLIGPIEQVNPDRVRLLFSTPFSVGEDSEELLVSVTQGHVRLEDEVQSGHEAVKRASIALKRAKELFRGEDCQFTLDMARETSERVKMLHNLRLAFEGEKLFQVYQPQIDMQSGEVKGFEALLRWKDDEGRFVPPPHFIKVAENSGLIIPLGDWAMRCAFKELLRLCERFGRDFRMGLNISMMQFRHPNFLPALDQAARDLGIKAERVELEITETVAMLDPSKVKGILTELVKRGYSVAIDDFGTGFSSLSYLEELPIHRLKIDKSFVDKLADAESESNLVEMIIELAQKLRLDVIAEGVETEAQAQKLLSLGCHDAQGYLYARPLPETELFEWLEQRS